MNAIVNEDRVPSRVTPHATHKFKWLLWREFWEHRGGFLWAPVIASAVFLFFTLLGGGFGQFAFNKFRADPANVATINGQEIPLGSVDFNTMVQNASAKDLQQWGEAVNGITMLAGVWPIMVFGVVVFFYFLGALYDERKDRSVMFWKSLPVSDTQTVLSKLATGLVVGPVIVSAIALALMLAFGVLASVFILINGGNPWVAYWSHLDLLRMFGVLLGWIPIYALWAMPTAGWLLLCSAWAKSKPFLWAILLPLGSAAMIGWFEVLSKMSGVGKWFAENVVVRILTGTWPGSHLLGYAGTGEFKRLNKTPEALFGSDGVIAGFHLLATPGLWIGVLAGAAMIYLAIRMRRWRDEA